MRATNDLTEFATVNLHYALAELVSLGDKDSISRALDHIRQAQGCLQIVMAEYDDIPEDEAEAA